ncbi:hypothetical protein [Bacillus carboniphilus]|uniref:hypothetical protein n=1 Tax=Bacillus carboniphilus TaxID=86663 RepID=UPI0031DC1B74
MKRIFASIIVFTFVIGLFSIGSSTSTLATPDPDGVEGTSKLIEVSEDEKETILNALQKNEKLLEFKTKRNESAKEMAASKGNGLVNIGDIEEKIKKDKSLIQLQVFNAETNESVLTKTARSLQALNGVKIKPSEDMIEKHKNDPFYSVDYTLILSTTNYTGFYDFTQFYINDRKGIHPDQLTHILEYNKENQMLDSIDMNFFKNQTVTAELQEPSDDTVSIACIACVGDIYTVKSTTYYYDWVDVAELNAIKGVTAKHTFSSSSGVSFEVKVAASGAGVESSGTVSNSLDSTQWWGPISGSSISSPGRLLTTKYQFKKTVYEKVKGTGPDEYTRVGVHDHIGSAGYGAYVYGNGSNYDSNSSQHEYRPPSGFSITQRYSNSWTGQAGTTAYGYGISLRVTSSSSSSNKSEYTFSSGAYDTYKVYYYGSKNRLTAKNF